jgi:hypothetical protein
MLIIQSSMLIVLRALTKVFLYTKLLEFPHQLQILGNKRKGANSKLCFQQNYSVKCAICDFE